MEELLKDGTGMLSSAHQAISDELDTVEEKLDTFTNLSQKLERLQLQIENSAWLPVNSRDYEIIENARRIATRHPLMFDKSVQQGYLPACDKKRAELIEAVEVMAADEEYMKDVKKRWQTQ